MKKILSRQIPRAQIVRPLLIGSVLVSLAGGGADALGCYIGPPPEASKHPDTSPMLTSPLQTAISGDKGCVTGALEAMQDQEKARQLYEQMKRLQEDMKRDPAPENK